MNDEAENDIDLNTDEEYELFSSTMSDDPVATVLKFHLLTEYLLERIIKIYLPRGDKLVDSSSFSYANKLTVVDSFNVIPDEQVSSLRNLNKVRNRCSHELNHEISNSELERIGSPLGKEWTNIKREKSCVSSRMGHLFALLSIKLNYEIRELEEYHHSSEEFSDVEDA